MQSKLPSINLLSYLGLIIVNILAVQIPFFGKTPGDVSALFPNLLTPANFSFKIWSVIYSLLGVFMVYQSRSIFRKKYSIPTEVSTIGYLFLISSILNICWLISWQSLHIALSFVFIFALWVVLIILYSRLAKLEKPKWSYTVPFSIYLAWICITCLANLNILLIYIDFDFFGLTQESWTASLIGVGIFGTLLVLYLNEDIWFTIVLLWAFFGIYTKNKQLATEDNWVIIMSLFAMIFLSIVSLVVSWRKWKKNERLST